MDQLKVALRYLKRTHFWIICPLVTLLGIGAWYMAVGSLDEEKEDAVGKIDSQYNLVRQVKSKSPHPNDNVASEMTKLIGKTREEIKKSWENKEAQQVAVLTWPDFPWSDSEKATFLRKVQPLRPIERTVKVDDQEKLNIAERENYRDYIWQELPKMAKQAGAAWVVNSDKSRVESEQKQANTVVVWDPASQKTIFEKHFQWKSGRPSTLQILYAQEDLWVLGHLMQIIGRTNEGATTRHSAAVRKISSIRIGKDAVYSKARVFYPGEQGKWEDTASESDNSTASVDGVADPAEGRYVDENYQPLSADVLRQVMEKDGELDPAQAYLAVAKRVPLRMRVSIDQRFINKLLVECANSELTVEVRQLLINPGSSGRSSSGRGGGAMREGAFGGGAGRAAGAGDVGSQFPYDLDVEIYGIVSIFNPVDQKALGISENEEARTNTDTIRR